jgi:hypothetical protein
VFGPFGRPAHVVGLPAPAVGAAHQILPIGKILPIGQVLLIGRMLLILPAPAVGATPHDKGIGRSYACAWSGNGSDQLVFNIWSNPE